MWGTIFIFGPKKVTLSIINLGLGGVGNHFLFLDPMIKNQAINFRRIRIEYNFLFLWSTHRDLSLTTITTTTTTVCIPAND